MSTGAGFGGADPATKLIEGLQSLGYRGPLIEEDYAFADWFAHQQERVATAAAFGQTPTSYESACIGVIRAYDVRGAELVNGFRSLGAPILLEIDGGDVREWAVSHTENKHELLATFRADQIDNIFSHRAKDWLPSTLLRAKSIGSFGWERQISLFSGLLPELESHIQAQLDPLLRGALAETRNAYSAETGRDPSPEQLFKVVFWTLTAKVFHDRRVAGFATLSPDPDELLAAVARQYRTTPPRALTRQAREVAAKHIWNELDFRNLSVEVLSQIWSTTLVDQATRKRLGIHRTPRTVVRYIIERIPFTPAADDDERIVFEPCCGSAAFLIGAMHALRQNLFGASSAERHKYFVKHLAGIEFDPFGAEISTLALTLADFPNPNGWRIRTADVFAPGAMTDELRSAGVVLCNPPFEKFTDEERDAYTPRSVQKPAELLNRVLDDLHPSGVLGFVLPLVAADGRGYSEIRERLARRYASLEFTALPDKVFDEADAETVLLVAKDPIPHDVTSVYYRRVRDDRDSWREFSRDHIVTSEHSANFGLHDARSGFRIPDLPEVWDFLLHNRRLGDFVKIHRGLQWNLSRAEDQKRPPGERLVRATPSSGFIRGVPPQAKFGAFETPPLQYLSIRPEDQRRTSWRLEWSKPKVILNKTTRSRGHWRITAFPDLDGVGCFETFNAIWPTSDAYDVVVISAILNSPVANAFIAAREGKTDIPLKTLGLIPIPVVLPSHRTALHDLVTRYQASLTPALFASRLGSQDDPERLLKEIDATILNAYRFPPRLERQLLDYFRGEERPVAHAFGDYFPPDFEVFLSLAEYLDPRIAGATVGSLVNLIESR